MTGGLLAVEIAFLALLCAISGYALVIWKELRQRPTREEVMELLALNCDCVDTEEGASVNDCKGTSPQGDPEGEGPR